MKKIKKLITAALLATFMLSASACGMIEKTPEAIAKSAVAKVNGVKITRAELDANPSTVQLMATIESYYGENYKTDAEAMSYLKTQKDSIVQQMISEELVLQKAKELNIGQDEAAMKTEIEAKYAEIKSGYATEEELTAALSSSGFNTDSFKAYLKDQLIIEKMTAEISKDVAVTDQEVQDYYDANPSSYTESPNTIHTAQILVATEDEAKAVKARLDAGEDFAAVAKEKSTDTASNEKGGDLGTVNYVDSGFDESFMAAAIALKAGEVSQPVQTSFGFHIIKCIEKTEYPVKAFDTVKAEIKQTILDTAKSEAISSKVAEWTEAADIKTYEDNIM
ncbi:MAG TPA: peptidylprolyl isomerase [Clostridiaceae bacterium]|nr:peptidylprolyl isomerase [Clostridiaceae bacterium]